MQARLRLSCLRRLMKIMSMCARGHGGIFHSNGNSSLTRRARERERAKQSARRGTARICSYLFSSPTLIVFSCTVLTGSRQKAIANRIFNLITLHSMQSAWPNRTRERYTSRRLKRPACVFSLTARSCNVNILLKLASLALCALIKEGENCEVANKTLGCYEFSVFLF